jgi:hypothetical protein
VPCRVPLRSKTSFGQVSLQSQAKSNNNTFFFYKGLAASDLIFTQSVRALFEDTMTLIYSNSTDLRIVLSVYGNI